MELFIKFIICIIAGYFIGSISTGMILSKIKGVDIHKEGSGGTGTTNVLRTLGKIPALITFTGDLAKVIIPIVIIRVIFGKEAEWYLMALYYGLGAVLGHSYPFYMGFKGGKGIAVTAAIIISTSHPIIIIIGVLAFIVIVAITRYVSVGSLLVVALLMPINTIVYYRDNPYFVHMLIISLIIMALDYIRHSANIKRLIAGKENKLF
ncbi:MAG: glycerol-3-phosphate 1-O-acyltransferase PlsY [Lachnospiraceae bacterium]|jgi:glycerol-3-phosphate acyltransferase PlsY|nr:glycerol-3-phosphate 1-O-acyltransferase PlsY [Lachnospiraceae bacterium]MEE3461139.1 glycerol-3-phosphate 1-O-acyltransferase PlsY [Lachnospiraceae bacterium]